MLYEDMKIFIHMTSGGVYIYIYTLYLHARQVRVTTGDSGLSCCPCVTYLEPLYVDFMFHIYTFFIHSFMFHICM